jgi:hypothetical protein
MVDQARKSRPNKGLTILEILMTIALLALIVVALIFFIRPSDDRTCQLEAERLVVFLNGASAESKISDTVLRVSFELKEKDLKFSGTALRQVADFAVDQLGTQWVEDQRVKKYTIKSPVKMTEVETHAQGIVKEGEAFLLFKSMRTTGGVVVLTLNQAIRSIWIPPGGQAIEIKKGRIPLHDLYERERLARLRGELGDDENPFFPGNPNPMPPPVGDTPPANTAPPTSTSVEPSTANPTPAVDPAVDPVAPKPEPKDASLPKDAGVQDMKVDAMMPDQYIECKMEDLPEKQQQDCLSKAGHMNACVDRKCVFSIVGKSFLSVRFLSVELVPTNLTPANQNQGALLEVASALLKDVLQGVNGRSPLAFTVTGSASGSLEAEQPHFVQWFQAEEVYPPTIQAKDSLYGYMNLPVYPLMAQLLPSGVGCPVDLPDSSTSIKKACYQLSPAVAMPKIFIRKIRNANRCSFEGVSLFENMNMYLQVMSLPDLNDPTMMRTVGRLMIDDTQRANPDEIRKLIDSLGNEQGSAVWTQIEAFDFKPKIKMIFELSERQLAGPVMNSPYDCQESTN